MATISRENNFDLIRLFAALQVVFWHTREHLGLSSKIVPEVSNFIRFFPGVPIFFTVSGFLIYAAFERNPSLLGYLKNRCLRIFPALWFAFLFVLITLFITGFVNSSNLFSKQFLAWTATQVTIFQFYTPQMLRGFGVGTPNGSLWTIFLEFSFYLFLPLFFWLVKNLRINKVALLLILMGVSTAYNMWYDQNFKTSESYLVKLLGLNLIPYLFYFLGGAIIYENWDKIKHWYLGKGLYWLLLYIVYCLIFSNWFHLFIPSYWPNIWGLISILILTQVVISLAYSNTGLSNKLLKHNDISYGLYLFHMPVINLILHYQLGEKEWAPLLVISAVFVLAYFSWIVIEKPALSLKNKKMTFGIPKSSVGL